MRSTVRRLMVAVGMIGACLAASWAGREGPDDSHLDIGTTVTVTASGASHVSGRTTQHQEIELSGGTRAVVIADDEDDRDDGSPEGRSHRWISVRLLEGGVSDMAVEMPRWSLRSD